MSSKPSPKPGSARPKTAKLAILLGLGMGFSGELAGSAWVGWWLGTWWLQAGGPKSAPGLGAMMLVVVALGHVIWMLKRVSARQDRADSPGEDR